MILCLCPNPSIDTFAWIDEILPGEANRIQKEKRFPGGKGVHVALAVGELGEKVQLLAFWGGPTGQWIKTKCEELGVSCHGPEINDWSRTCMTFKSPGDYRDTELLGAGPTIDDAYFASFVNEYRKLVVTSDCVCMSGSWPHGAPSDAYAQLVMIAQTMGTPVLLDTTGEQLQHALTKRPAAVHLNRMEIQALLNMKDVRAAALLLAQQCDYAIVTSGADGLYLAHRSEVVHAHCHVDQVYSAVGSGDCLLAGFAVALKCSMSIQDVARLAVACGAANCVREDLGMLYKKDVERLLPSVTVSSV